MNQEWMNKTDGTLGDISGKLTDIHDVLLGTLEKPGGLLADVECLKKFRSNHIKLYWIIIGAIVVGTVGLLIGCL